ncbi:MAG: hypothetical protein ACXWPI_19240 [Ktedonobacterales bacterium]
MYWDRMDGWGLDDDDLLVADRIGLLGILAYAAINWARRDSHNANKTASEDNPCHATTAEASHPCATPTRGTTPASTSAADGEAVHPYAPRLRVAAVRR